MKGDQSERTAAFNLYLLKPQHVQSLWDAADPNKFAQRLILEHIEDVSEQTGENWRSWNENEDRFEANELKWISDFIVRNLVFIRCDLKIEEPDACSHLMQCLWKSLDLLNSEAATELAEASQNRFVILMDALKRLFE